VNPSTVSRGLPVAVRRLERGENIKLVSRKREKSILEFSEIFSGVRSYTGVSGKIVLSQMLPDAILISGCPLHILTGNME